MEDLRIAAVCMQAEPGNIDRNMERMQTLAFRASAAGAELVCFPELSVTGYVMDEPQSVYAELNWQEVAERLVGLAQETNVVLLAGLIEIPPGERPYISQVVAGPGGMTGIYRKTHLGPPESRSFQAGKKVPVFRHRNTQFGLQLCYETHFPEISTIMALMGADVIFFPHASPRGNPASKLESWLRHLRARAFDNGIFVAACNQVGRIPGGLSFPGVAVLIGPDGRVLQSYEGDSENVLVADIQGSLIREVRSHRMKYFLPNRRPELYGKLVET